MTFPTETVNGVMVAQTNTVRQLDTAFGKQIWKGSLIRGVPGQVYPEELQNSVMNTLERVESDLPGLTRDIFGEFGEPLTELGRRLWDNCQWAFRADATYLQVVVDLVRERGAADLTLVYMGGPDVVGHRFWRYMRPELYSNPPPPGQIDNLGDVIEDYYAYTDRALGTLMETFGREATFVVLSDHGMGPVNLDRQFNEDAPPVDVNSAAHEDAPPGLFVAAGPSVRRLSAARPEELNPADLRPVGGVLDVTPTLLAMMRVPLARDMDGQVLHEMFRPEFGIGEQPSPVDTHDDEAFLQTRDREPSLQPDEEGRLEQLRSLGYIR
jgi:hypothetical protein